MTFMIRMVHLFRPKESPEIKKQGYSARYYADIQFSQYLDTAGFIFVTIAAGTETEPHAHEQLQELFVALTPLSMIVDKTQFELVPGDLLLVEPSEFHSIKAPMDNNGKLLAIKCPNLKSDKKLQLV